MKAKIKPGFDEKRQLLKDVIPLNTPYTLFIAPTQLCNFKCHYCAHSLPSQKKKEEGLILKHLKDDLFDKIVEDSKKFPNRFKRILLTGLGEPLMNPNIVNMVNKLAKANISDNIEIFTNASYLTNEISDGLIDAGLTKLRISIQGTDAEQYKKNCGITINFSKLISNINYFYTKSRSKCSIYIKIINEELKDNLDRDNFLKIFGDMCDEIFVETLVRAQPVMGDYNNKVNTTLTFYGEKAQIREVCPYIFYTLQIDAEGNCFPCPPLSLPKSFSLGNVNDTQLTKIWNGEVHKNLMTSHLQKNKDKFDICKKCSNYLCFTPEEDNLDNHTNTIIDKIGKLK